jgi:hypothetical protein
MGLSNTREMIVLIFPDIEFENLRTVQDLNYRQYRFYFR